jgi:hypothetical protein
MKTITCFPSACIKASLRLQALQELMPVAEICKGLEISIRTYFAFKTQERTEEACKRFGLKLDKLEHKLRREGVLLARFESGPLTSGRCFWEATAPWHGHDTFINDIAFEWLADICQSSGVLDESSAIKATRGRPWVSSANDVEHGRRFRAPLFPWHDPRMPDHHWKRAEHGWHSFEPMLGALKVPDRGYYVLPHFIENRRRRMPTQAALAHWGLQLAEKVGNLETRE